MHSNSLAHTSHFIMSGVSNCCLGKNGSKETNDAVNRAKDAVPILIVLSKCPVYMSSY